MNGYFSVGTGTDGKIISELPIVKVMPAAVPSFGLGRHFIVIKTAGCGFIPDQIGHILKHIVIRNPFGRKFGKIGVRLQGQLIAGQMRRSERKRGFQLFVQFLNSLAGKPEH